MQSTWKDRTGRVLAAGLLGAALTAAGCSHAPKPSAEAPEAGEATKHAAASHAKPAAPPSDGVVSGSSTSAPADSTKAQVLPQLTPAQAKEMDLLSKNNVDAARTMLNSIDATKLDTDQTRKYEIAKGFVNDAVTARAQQDWMRAAQLATKAKLLAEELTGQ